MPYFIYYYLIIIIITLILKKKRCGSRIRIRINMIRIIMTGSNWLCLYQELIMFLRQCDDTVTLGLFRYNKAGVYIIRIIDIFGPYPFFKNHIFFPNYSKKNPSFPPVFQFLPLIFAFF